MKPAKTVLGSLIALGLNSNLWALPQDPSPIHGQVRIENGANFVQILQQTPQAIINWGQFNIGLGETVRFLQPGQQSAILNRVTGMDPSVIQGMLQANGRVFLLNPNGILFGPNAVVDVGSFTASTLKMSDEDFLNGTYKLTQDSSLPLAALTNQGTIRVAEGGFVVLVSPLLDNQGMILAQSGHVNLGATTQATFSVDGRGLVQFVVPDGFDPQFQGGGQGGTVLLQPGQMSQLLSQVVANPTLVEAGSFQSACNGQVLAHGAEGLLLNSGVVSTDGTSRNGGNIRLDSSQATILPASGRLSANSQAADGGDVRLLSAGRTVSLGNITAAANGTGRGGFAEISGKDLWLLGMVDVGSAQGAGGTILIDPTDITIVDGAGGTFDGQLPNPGGAGAGTVSVTAMQGQSAVQLIATNNVLYNGTGFNLGATSLSVDAGNDILFNTNSSIQATALTLVAGRDITIASPGELRLGSNAGALTLQAGRDLTLTAASNLFISSPVQSSLTATTGHLRTSSGNGALTRLDSPRTEMVAAQNLTVTASSMDQSLGSNPVFLSGRNVTLQNPAGQVNYRVGSLNVTAAENFSGTANSNFTLRTLAGPLNVTAAGSLDVSPGSGVALRSDTDRLTLTAADIQVRGQNGVANLQGGQGVNATASGGDLRVSAVGSELRVEGGLGSVNVTAARDLSLTSGSNLFVSSTGGNRLEAGRHLNSTSANGAVNRLDGRTEMVAAQNLTVTASSVDQSSGPNPVFMSGRNVTLQNPVGEVSYRVGSLNVTATENFSGTANSNFTLRTLAGPLNVTAVGSLDVSPGSGVALRSDTDRLTLTAADIQVRGQNGVANLQGGQGVNATARSGDVRVSSVAGELRVEGGSGVVNVTAARDVTLSSGSNLFVSSTGGNRLEAGRHLNSTSVNNAVTRLDGPRTELLAAQNLTVTASDMDQVSGNNPVFMSGRNVTLQNPVGQVNYRVGSLNVTAAENFSGTANSNFTLRTLAGPLNVTAVGSLDVSSGSGVALRSDTDRLTLTAADIQVRGQNGVANLQGGQGVNATARSGDVRVSSVAGELRVEGGSGVVNVTAARDVTLSSGSNLFVSSTGGNRLEAGRHLNSTSVNNAVTRLDGPRTELLAAQNLTVTASDMDQVSGNNPVFMSGRNVTLQNPVGQVNYRVGSLNVTAAEKFSGTANSNFSVRALTGPLNVTAGGSLDVSPGAGVTLRSDTDRLTLTAADIQVRGQNGGANLQGVQGVNVTSTGGDLRISSAPGHELRVEGGSGSVNVTAAQDLSLSAGTNLFVSSASGNRLVAGRDLSTSSGNGALTRLDSPRTELVAGQNLTMTSSLTDQSSGSNPVLLSGRNVTLQNPVGNLNFQVGSLNVTAQEDFSTTASGGVGVRTFNGPLAVTAGANFSATAPGGAGLRADTGGVELTAGNLALSNVGINSINGPLNLTSSGNLSVGALATSAGANAFLSGANITIQSMQNVSGGNYTITTPGNLTEVTPATSPPQLAGLNITAGRVFNLNAPNLGFSIPQTGAGNLTALVTGGNETTVNPVQAASFRNFGTPDVDPRFIDFQTGDIYVDGVLVYGGLKPPDPPLPPPPPPPTPDPPPTPEPPPVVPEPVTPEQAVQRENALTPEERSQILAQSNLALGNLGSFSRVLSDSEREQLTSRQDSLHQTWSLDPFSPTLALTVPGGVPPVYASELAQLQALLMMASPADDPEDKNRQAYNVIVDQELREIWEVRYFRHLLERFIIWEDRE